LGKADLHTHTTASDGACSPAELIELAFAKKLEAISITDHDTLKGYDAAESLASERGLKLIPGVEITTIIDTKEVHILAYGFDPANDSIRNLMRSQRKARNNRMEQIVHQLKKQGVDISIDEVKAEARMGNLGRPHLAKVMVNKKIVASIGEAFIRYISSEKLTDLEINYASFDHVVKNVREAGGATVLAHPVVYSSDSMIESLIDAGLDGIECIHPSHNYDAQKKYTSIAEKRGLLVTGGSDFHGNREDYDAYFGIVTLSMQRLANLERVTSRRKVKESTSLI
jgi:predicted metal-dependent phosphoesterase TrpH